WWIFVRQAPQSRSRRRRDSPVRRINHSGFPRQPQVGWIHRGIEYLSLTASRHCPYRNPRRRSAFGLCVGMVVFLQALSGAFAQTIDTETTAGEIRALRRQKQQILRPERPNSLHRTILYVRQNKIPEKITYGYKGIRPRFGTLGPGSGFGLGIEYFRP